MLPLDDVRYFYKIESRDRRLLRCQVVEERGDGHELAVVLDAEIGFGPRGQGLQRRLRAGEVAQIWRRRWGQEDVVHVQRGRVAGRRRDGVVGEGLQMGHGGLHVYAGGPQSVCQQGGRCGWWLAEV